MGQLYHLALGANVASKAGGRSATIKAAIAAMTQAGLRVRAVSRFFKTPCFPPGAGPDFINACVSVASELDPQGVLERLHELEARFGRARAERWGTRTLDVDLIAADAVVLPSPEALHYWLTLPPEAQQQRAPDNLVLPHPRLQDRAFVLVPLADIAPGWRHPVLGKTVHALLSELDPQLRAEVVPL